MSVSGIILAAGESKRFNGIKQLAKIDDKTLLEIVVDNLSQSSIDSLYVCLGANAEKIKAVLPNNIKSIVSENWQKGLGHSIADSIDAIGDSCDSVLLLLADQIKVPTAHLDQLMIEAKLHPKKIIATSVGGLFLPPVIFPKKYFQQLKLLQGDKGAAHLLKQHSDQVLIVTCEQAKVDIDTADDLDMIQQDILIHEMEEI